MIPAGVERDKRIAELKGELSGEVNGMFCQCCSHEHCSDCYKPYSTDIACAMELWEEMKEDNHVIVMKYYAMPKKCCKPEQKGIEVWLNGMYQSRYSGETEADAISGCWLEWKEDK